jgi:hypothetical protein
MLVFEIALAICIAPLLPGMLIGAGMIIVALIAIGIVLWFGTAAIGFGPTCLVIGAAILALWAVCNPKQVVLTLIAIVGVPAYCIAFGALTACPLLGLGLVGQQPLASAALLTTGAAAWVLLIGGKRWYRRRGGIGWMQRLGAWLRPPQGRNAVRIR